MEIYDAYGKRKAEKFYVVISFFCIHLVPQKSRKLKGLRLFLCFYIKYSLELASVSSFLYGYCKVSKINTYRFNVVKRQTSKSQLYTVNHHYLVIN